MDSNQVAIGNIAEALFSAKYQKPAYVIVIAQKNLNKQFSFEEKLTKLKEELRKKTKEFEESRKEEGNEKLGVVKKEAGELYTSRISTAEKEKNEKVRTAEEKKQEAVSAINKHFLDHIK